MFFYVHLFAAARCLLFTTLMFLATSSTTNASNFSGCSTQFYQQATPVILKNNFKRHSYALCFSGFSVLYSGLSRTPLYSAEYLTPRRLKKARKLDRRGTFRWDIHSQQDAPDVVPENHQAKLSDYSRSGYDRGHMAPNADMATRQQQSDSFYLANMVPQSPRNNQEVWRHLETATRAVILRNYTPAYVITGPIFLGNKIGKVGNILIPTHVYKAVYFPEINVASAYLTPNDDSGDVQVVNVAKLESLIGINLFPTLPNQVKQVAVNLPLHVQEIKSGRYKFSRIATNDLVFQQKPQTAQPQRQTSAFNIAPKQPTRRDKPRHIPQTFGGNIFQRARTQITRWWRARQGNF